ncbi:uncharacterized protein METZ01_LOCUS336093, partial [marine metagenome]
VGLGRLELPTSRLSGVRSNHLSYKPKKIKGMRRERVTGSTISRSRSFGMGLLLRKEVFQPHLPVRLPCYDFAPVT